MNQINSRDLFRNLITLYGRKPVLEVMSDPKIEVFRLHLADSNRDAAIIGEIRKLAAERGVEIVMHSKQELSRISKNGRQDQGVAVDVNTGRYRSISELPGQPLELIALDRVTNPQNLGMIIRSIAASPMHGLLLPRKGSAKIDPLVFKASAGTLFKARIYHCESLSEGLAHLKQQGCEIIGMDGAASTSLNALPASGDRTRVFILGNETDGLGADTLAACDLTAAIPLENQVESLNVATVATLIAFRSLFTLTD